MDAFSGFGRSENSFPAYTELSAADFLRIIKAGKSGRITYENLLSQMSTDIADSIAGFEAANTVQVNSLDSLPAAVGGEITLLPATRYVWNEDITIPSGQYLKAQNGTVIDMWSAQRSIIRSTHPDGAVQADAGGGFITFIVSGPGRIINTAGHGIKFANGAFMIYSGIFMTVSNSHYGIYGSNAAAASIENSTVFGSAIGLYMEGSTPFGTIVDTWQSTQLAGVGIRIGSDAATSNNGVVTLNNLNATSVGNGLEIIGKASSVVMSSQARLVSTTGKGAVFSNTLANKVSNLFISQPSFTGGGSHGLDISGGFFTDINLINGLCETSSAASYGLYGVAGSTNISSSFRASNVVFQNSATPANKVFGMASSDLVSRFFGCSGVRNSQSKGSFSLTTRGVTQASVGTTPVRITAGTTQVVSERFTITQNKLKYIGEEPIDGKLNFTVVASQNAGASRLIIVEAYKNGLTLGSNAYRATSDGQNNRLIAIPLTGITIPLVKNDEIELYISIETGTATITYDTVNCTVVE